MALRKVPAWTLALSIDVLDTWSAQFGKPGHDCFHQALI
jgi:hypothetical protein